MKVIVPKNAGVCWGVERAIDMAYQTIHESQYHKIVSLGPLVHNPEVVEDFKSKGVEVISDLKESQAGTVVFRSHGVPLNTYEEAKTKGLEVVDATCPFVKRSQNYARRFSRQGYFVVIVGDEKHPEMKSVRSFSPGPHLVTMNPKDLEKIPVDSKVGLIAQTTIPLTIFEAMVEAAQKRFPEVKTHDTICDATKIRQEEAAETARQVECMLIIGGKESSNTKKLTKICKEIQPKSYEIEHEREIDFSWFEGVKILGVTAGASTPVPVIQRVCSYILDNLSQKRIQQAI
ncbi:MAG: 4-hydroxy-3-methylbut-2-enyl diphosphate reductase [Deltaproteobacteria bacterium]|nr:4-hydroxy-3-methylbut-2-enyl diphosphate reductase [Deltaproteobacteria bacterium]